MRKNTTILTLAAVSAAWGAAAQAEEGTKSKWDMSETAAPFIKPESSVTLGYGYLHGKREQFGIFDDRRNSGMQMSLDANINLRDEETGAWATAKGRNLGLHDPKAQLGFNQQGHWGLNVGYDQIPRYAPYTAVTAVQGLGTQVLTVPKLSSSATSSDHKIGTERERFSLESYKYLNENFKVNLGVKHEIKEGTRQWGRGGQPEFALEPIDWTTSQMETSLSYLGKNTQISGGYNGSWFENTASLVDTIYAGDAPGTVGNHIYLSVPLDNEAHQLYVQGAHNFTPATRGTFKLAYTRALQNEPLDTAGINGLAFNVAPSSLQGRVDSTLATVGLTSQVTSKLRMVGQLRYTREEDKTPDWLIVTNASPVHATPLSNETFTGKLEGTYKLPFQLGLTTSVEQKNQNRQIPFGNDSDKDGLDNERFVPFRRDIDETNWLIQLRRSLTHTLNGSIGYQYGVREGSKFTDSAFIGGTKQGKISPFFIADRERDKWRLALDWNPLSSLDVQVNFEHVHDTYHTDSQPYGRKKGEGQIFSVDADYAFTSKLIFNAWYSHDVNEVWQSTALFGAVTAQQMDKHSILKDTGDTMGLGVRNQLTSRIKLGANTQYTLTRSRFNDVLLADPGITNYDKSMSPLLDIRSTTAKLNTFLEYAKLGPGTLRFDWVHERWHTNDWTWEFSNGSPFTFGSTTDGTTILTREHQSANFLGLRYTTFFK